jgi:hypothetical protein
MKSLLRFFTFALLFAVALPAFAQTPSSGPFSITSSQCVTIGVSSSTATIGIQVTGTWTGTLQPEIAISGQAAANTQVIPSTSSTPQSTITANGIYTASVAGASLFLLCGNTVSSGTAVVFLNGSTGLGSGLPRVVYSNISTGNTTVTGAYSTVFTTPAAGIYRVNAASLATALGGVWTASINTQVTQNGSAAAQANTLSSTNMSTGAWGGNGTVELSLASGATIAIGTFGSPTGGGTYTYAVTIERLQ